MTPAELLIDAVFANDATKVNLLLMNGVDPNSVLDAACVTPLYCAAQNNSVECAKLLIKNG